MKKSVFIGVGIVILLIIIGVFLLIPRGNNNQDNNAVEKECSNNNDCIPATCCHPNSCSNIDEKPDCSAVSCTAECSGPLDCGEGECRCINNKCQVFDLIPNTAGTGTPSGSSETYNINIQNFAYSNTALTIKQRDIITWTNKDSARHTVTSDSGSELDSELLDKEESYSHTFNTAGTYNYHCTPHPYMKGKVIVE